MNFHYDVIVVGAGHAGCEASAAAANLGSSTLLITMDMNKIAQMSCNPAMGGIAKGQIVREIDALGGYAGIVADKTGIQFRMLNKSKGPAMWSPRTQNDRALFIQEWKQIIENTDNLYLWQDTVNKLIIEDGKVVGVLTGLQEKFYAKSVVLTNGTFLNGLMHIGDVQLKGGRVSEPASYGISEQLAEVGFTTGRMKTGTPVRVDGRSVDFSKLIEQKGDDDQHKFSYLPHPARQLKQVSCYIAHTNPETHKILADSLEKSPLYNGQIQSIGPRYCPSIETKIITFADKNKHQLFLEPEGLNTQEYYLNGYSSSLPLKAQVEALMKVPGFENVRIYRPGYAIEYDFFDPTQLKHTLETKILENLYFAGQINGTTGYEEAGAQGIIAGINAHQNVRGEESFVLGRNEAYIGVLIDDLVTKGVDEPYRMFTSRAEYRILLRQDDADFRLTQKAYDLGIVSEERFSLYKDKLNKVNKILEYLTKTSIAPSNINQFLSDNNTTENTQNAKLVDILKRPQIKLKDLLLVDGIKKLLSSDDVRYNEIIEAVEIKVKYAGYIAREELIAKKLKRLEDIKIKDRFDYATIKNISTEARQKLTSVQPETIGQASRISGVSPSDLNVLLVMMGR